MIGKLERATEVHQKVHARLGTLPDILLSVAGGIASLVVLIFAVVLIKLFWLLLFLGILGFWLSAHIMFTNVIPEWATHTLEKRGGESRWATKKEMRVLYGPSDYTAP